jgi:hypothetical protein
MKYIKTLVGALFAIALLLSVTAVSAVDLSTNAAAVGPWTFALSGGGSSAINNDKLNNSTVGLNLELGHTGKLLLPIEGGIRQGISYSDVTDSSWALSTKAYLDPRLFRIGNLQSDAGVNIGAAYGDQPLKWTAAPEADLRFYLKKDVNLFGRIEAPFDLNAANDTFGRFENKLSYTIGLQVLF